MLDGGTHNICCSTEYRIPPRALSIARARGTGFYKPHFNPAVAFMQGRPVTCLRLELGILALSASCTAAMRTVQLDDRALG